MSVNDTIQAGSQTFKKMDPEAKAVWIEALRSRQYRQTKSRLRQDDECGPAYCCLGVLCDVTNRGNWQPEVTSQWYTTQLGASMDEVPEDLGNALSLSKEAQYHLIGMNDEEGSSFSEIADWIEKNL